MRLRSDQLRLIIEALSPYMSLSPAILYLFGSRTKDHLKGGDIDLALIIENEKVLGQLQAEKYKIMSSLHRLLGERKIDLRLGCLQASEQDPFFQLVLPTSIKLYSWPTPAPEVKEK